MLDKAILKENIDALRSKFSNSTERIQHGRAHRNLSEGAAQWCYDVSLKLLQQAIPATKYTKWKDQKLVAAIKPHVTAARAEKETCSVEASFTFKGTHTHTLPHVLSSAPCLHSHVLLSLQHACVCAGKTCGVQSPSSIVVRVTVLLDRTCCRPIGSSCACVRALFH